MINYDDLNQNIKVGNPLKQKFCIERFLNKKECEIIIKKSEELGEWTTKRHKNYPTTDIPIKSIPGLDKIKTKIVNNISALIKNKYYLDNQSTIEAYDLFVVKYDMNGQRGLDIHRDSSEFSFVLLLSNPDNFEGGGTYYEEDKLLINPDKQGSLSVHFGKVKHSGKNITKGTRYILIGFLKVESNKIMKPNKYENEFKGLKLCDKRHYDFYWIGYDIKPIKILVKIINLKHRPEKLEQIMEYINRLIIPDEITFDVQVHEANTGDKGVGYLNWQQFKEYVPSTIKKFYSREITKGEIGCFNSHIDIIKTCSNIDYLLILEDDAIFHSDFVYRINQVIRELNDTYWDAIDFGGVSVDEQKDIKITESIIKKGSVFQTHCILYSSDGISKIKKINTTENIIPYDDFLNAIRGIHFIDKLNYFETKFSMFNYYMQLSRQKSGDIHDTENNIVQDTEVINITNEPFISISDTYNLINWYRFSNLTDVSLDKIKKLFNILNIKGSFTKTNITKWKLPLDSTKKITIVLPLEDNSSLELYQDEIKQIDVKKNSVIMFPSYLLFKCTDSAIFYANGDTFK